MELEFLGSTPILVLQDNLGTISWTERVQGLRNVKHVGLKYQIVKEAVEKKPNQVLYTPSERNIVDSLTKTPSCSAGIFARWRDGIALTA